MLLDARRAGVKRIAMNTSPYRARLLEELRDPEFSVQYFLAAAQSADPEFLRIVVRDLLETGGGVYPYVEMTKLRASAHAVELSGNWGEYRVGESNQTSLPIDYRLTGILIRPPRMGAAVIILRLTRNGLAVPGVYQSTEVTRVGEGEFETLNSVYQLKILPI